MTLQTINQPKLPRVLRQLCSRIVLGSMLLSAALPLWAKSPADPNKVLHAVFPVAETGFDPAGTYDLYSAQVNTSIFEGLYTYDYLASPVKLVPRTALAMPEVSADGLSYVIRLKKGIYFAKDPVFKGKPRELTAQDYVYSYQRLVDPQLRSPNSWLFDGKILGMDAAVAQAQKTGKFNYDQPVAGLRAIDRYTLQIKLTSPDHNFPMLLAHQPAGAVAREVIEHYRNKSGYAMANPVGTGPYMLAKWLPGSRIILKANPDYAAFVWNFKASSAADQAIVRAMKGKKMPQIGVIDIHVIEEAQSRWLAFSQAELDLLALSGDSLTQALQNGQLKPELAKKGIQLSRIIDPTIDYHYWNMQNPIVGGLSPDKIALRRAMAMAYSADQEINILRNGDANKLQYPIPAGIIGHDAQYKSSIPYSVKAANLLLDRYHYKVGADGWRRLPNGQPLQIVMTLMGSDLRSQQQAEFWKKNLDSLHIRFSAKSMPFAEAIKMEKQCQTMFKSSAWIADYPDGDNFMQLFYGKNIHATNNACVQIPAYDRLYEQSQKLNPGPARDALYHKMARILEVYTAVQIEASRYRNTLAQPRVIGFKKHPILPAEWMYFDVAK
jgi:oligopeptide transport system substrate-binding protein